MERQRAIADSARVVYAIHRLSTGYYWTGKQWMAFDRGEMPYTQARQELANALEALHGTDLTS